MSGSLPLASPHHATFSAPTPPHRPSPRPRHHPDTYVSARYLGSNVGIWPEREFLARGSRPCLADPLPPPSPAPPAPALASSARPDPAPGAPPRAKKTSSGQKDVVDQLFLSTERLSVRSAPVQRRLPPPSASIVSYQRQLPPRCKTPSQQRDGTDP